MMIFQLVGILSELLYFLFFKHSDHFIFVDDEGVRDYLEAVLRNGWHIGVNRLKNRV